MEQGYSVRFKMSFVRLQTWSPAENVFDFAKKIGARRDVGTPEILIQFPWSRGPVIRSEDVLRRHHLLSEENFLAFAKTNTAAS